CPVLTLTQPPVPCSFAFHTPSQGTKTVWKGPLAHCVATRYPPGTRARNTSAIIALPVLSTRSQTSGPGGGRGAGVDMRFSFVDAERRRRRGRRRERRRRRAWRQ